jgi:2-hydroxychromene-2-carboxylate isomerase
MSGPIEYFFDFSSPYGYFASFRIDALAEDCGRACTWKPIMIGAAFKETGNLPLIEQPLKGAYCAHDWQRMGRGMGVPWVLPEPFPIPTLAAARAFYWLDDRDSGLAKLFARAAFHAYFGEGRDIAPAETVAEIATGVGADGAAVAQAVANPAIKERLKHETTDAIARGVVGSPYFMVDGEGFWGCDRLWMVKKWIKGGGW